MVTGRICAPNGVLTAPISGSPCVAYFYEISEFVPSPIPLCGETLTKLLKSLYILPLGFGFRKIYAEKRNNAFEIIDPQFPDVRIMIDEGGGIIAMDKSSNAPYSLEYMTDVALAHVCPTPEYTYDMPQLGNGDIQATTNLLRGYPLKFGMMDGEGDGVRVEVPENIEQLFVNAKISRFKNKSLFRRLREAMGKNYDGDEEFRTFFLTEMSIRVNDQVNIVAGFEQDSSNANIKRAVPLGRQPSVVADSVNEWVEQARNAVFELTKHEKAIVITKFPRVGDIKSLPKGLVWSQEQGVFSNFVLQEQVEQNMKNADFRADQAAISGSPHAHRSPNRQKSEKGGPASPTAEDKQARAYLFSKDANKRLGNEVVEDRNYHD